MSDRIHLERHFLCYIAHSTNYKQVKCMLHWVDTNQYKVLREIAYNILKSTIILEEATRVTLKEHKIIIRALAKGKLGRRKLGENSKIITEIVRLALQHHAYSNKQECDSSDRGMGESEQDDTKK